MTVPLSFAAAVHTVIVWYRSLCLVLEARIFFVDLGVQACLFVIAIAIAMRWSDAEERKPAEAGKCCAQMSEDQVSCGNPTIITPAQATGRWHPDVRVRNRQKPQGNAPRQASRIDAPAASPMLLRMPIAAPSSSSPLIALQKMTGSQEGAGCTPVCASRQR